MEPNVIISPDDMAVLDHEDATAPVPDGGTLARLDVDHLIHPFTNLVTHQTCGPTIIVRGRGVHVYDATGREYIEGVAGIWCSSLGLDDQRLVRSRRGSWPPSSSGSSPRTPAPSPRSSPNRCSGPPAW